MKIEEPLAIEFKPLQKVSPFFLVDPQNDKAISNKQYVWIKAAGKLPDDLRFHHIVAAYACDHYLLTTALLPNHLSSFSTPRLKMMASLDHTYISYFAFYFTCFLGSGFINRFGLMSGCFSKWNARNLTEIEQLLLEGIIYIVYMSLYFTC